ncbi:MAG TPA: hypothetical protein PKK00_01420 [Bacteroidales bacterium]|nr:hypothetical protein [Bacteroidales bacterium]HPS16023.1 hypothetical protein [Bacteroidales bacterium]
MKSGFPSRVKFVDIIYKGVDDELLFAGPVKLEQENGKNSMALDFTTEFINKTSDSVVFRFTIISKKQGIKFPEVSISSNDTIYSAYHFKLMFNESRHKKYYYRYSLIISYDSFSKILESKSFKLIFNNQNIFNTSKHWQKNANEIKNKISLIASSNIR